PPHGLRRPLRTCAGPPTRVGELADATSLEPLEPLVPRLPADAGLLAQRRERLLLGERFDHECLSQAHDGPLRPRHARSMPNHGKRPECHPCPDAFLLPMS